MCSSCAPATRPGASWPRPFSSDEEKRRAYRRAYLELEGRIKIFTSLPIEKLDLVALKKRLDDIGRTPPLSA